MIAPIDKIKSLLNEDIVSLFGEDVINNAYIEAYKSIINLIADEFIIENLANSNLRVDRYISEHTSNTDADAKYNRANFTNNRRLLTVLRKNTNGTDFDGVYYEAIKIPTVLGETQAGNSKSIYYENDRWSPKYYIKDNGGVELLPVNIITSTEHKPQAKIFFITFPDFSAGLGVDSGNTFNLNGKNFSAITKVSEETLFYGIPGAAKELLYIEMALNLVQNYMADFIYEEEDQEIVNLAKEHAAALLAKKQNELNIVLPKYSNERKA